MIEVDENALICDLAETYHIYDYRSLPVELVATLSAGLRENSRIKMKMSGVRASQTDILLSILVDRLGVLIYGLGGQKGNPPEQYQKYMYIQKEKSKEKPMSFKTGKEFDEARNRILRSK